MRIKFITAVFTAISLGFSAQLAVADTPTPAFVSPDAREVAVGHWRFFFTPSFLLPLSYLPLQTPPVDLRSNSVLPPCTEAKGACLMKVEYQLASGDWYGATPGEDFGQRQVAFGNLKPDGTWNMNYTSTFPEDAALNRPQGSTARLWTFDKAPHAAGVQYQVAASIGGQVDQNGKYRSDQFNLQVIPVTQKNVNSSEECLRPSDLQVTTEGTSKGLCLTKYDFPKDLRIRVTVNLDRYLSSIQGWFDGRLFDAKISIDANARTLSVEGAPMMVPSASNSDIKYEDIKNIPAWPNDPLVIAAQNKGNTGTAGFANTNTEMDLINFIALGETIRDRAIGENTIWKISSMSAGPDTRCLQPGQMNGVVLTNATVYVATAPKWDAASSSLNFRVAASHNDSKGDIFKGYYSLFLNEKVAACYWGSDFSKGSASISITNQDGTPGVATTNLGVRNGWVNFEASGFTFSAPTISARIKKAEPAAIKTTISCISSKKIVKKVSGVNPKCPAGYKKK